MLFNRAEGIGNALYIFLYVKVCVYIFYIKDCVYNVADEGPGPLQSLLAHTES